MSRRPKTLRNPFTDLEQAVMAIVWKLRAATAETIREDLAPRRLLKESTMRTLLSRLEKKGHLRHEVDGRAYVYSSIDEPRSLAVWAVRQIIDRFCAGSVEQLITGMVDGEVLNADELRRLANEIEKNAKKGGER